MNYYSLFALCIYFAAMLAIGLCSYRQSTDSLSGYLLGGRKVSPQVTALSAGASDMSGWMLMGLPGAMLLTGFNTIWIAIGLVIGAYLNYLLVAPRLRVFTEIANDALTIPDYFSKRFNKDTGFIKLLSAIVIIIFFTLYTSSGLVAGGKLFESAFGLPYQWGLFATLSVVVIYTLLGGFLAVSLTDFVQGSIMFIALILVPAVALNSFDNFSSMEVSAYQTLPTFNDAINNLTFLGLISSLAWGLGYFGQPHIIVRFMAIRSVKDLVPARRIGMSWMIVTILGALSTGFVGAAYVNQFNLELKDPETIFIVFSQILFNPFITGLLLAAILAAIMSTISSQLLVSSSSLTEDIYRTFLNKNIAAKRLVNLGRLGVLIVAGVALILALDSNNTVLALVSNAWAGFGAAFGPLVLLSLFWSRMTYKGAIAGVLTGAIVVLLWIYLPVLANGKTLSSLLYEMVPGFIMSGLAIVIVSLLDNNPSNLVIKRFSYFKQRLLAS